MLNLTWSHYRIFYVCCVLLLAVLVTGTSKGYADTINISCGALGKELKICQEAINEWSKNTGQPVKVISTPNSATERYALYQQILASKSSDIDILQIDVVWPGTLAPHLVDLNTYLPPKTVDKIKKQHFSALITNNTIDGRLVAIPWFTAAGVLYYRKDLLAKYSEQPPTTWQALTKIARRIQQAERNAGNERMHGFVYQAKGYEGLTCNALEWIHSFGGGKIVGNSGEITLNNPKAVAALKLAKQWVGDIAPQGVLNYDEEQSRGVFQSGNAVFMRNWPYAWALGNADDSPIKGKFGVMAMPKGGPEGNRTSVLGGWQLAVSKYSRNPKLAADLVRYLTSYKIQKRRAIEASYNPTIKALYQDPDVLESTPFFGTLYKSFSQAVARPSRITGPKYARVSAEFYYGIHDILTGKLSAEVGLENLHTKLERLSNGGEW